MTSYAQFENCRRVVLRPEYPEGIRAVPIFAFNTHDGMHLQAALTLEDEWRARTRQGVGTSTVPHPMHILRLEMSDPADTTGEPDLDWLDSVNAARNKFLNDIEQNKYEAEEHDAVFHEFERQVGWELGVVDGFAWNTLINDMIGRLRFAFPSEIDIFLAMERKLVDYPHGRF